MQRLDEIAMLRKADVSHWDFQLTSGHTVTGSFLRYIGKIEKDRC